MNAISPRLGEFLIKTTGATDLDNAMRRLFSDYLEVKLESLDRADEKLRIKWGMDFSTFQTKRLDGELKADSYSYDVEKDFWQWEEVVTLRDHYQTLKNERM